MFAVTVSGALPDGDPMASMGIYTAFQK